MAKAFWVVTFILAANIIVFGTLYLLDKEKYLGWLINFGPNVLHFIHFNDIYDIMKSPKWVERVMRMRDRKTITVFSGDVMSPSILAESMKGSQFVELLDMIHLDYAVPGNHEADFGVTDFYKFWKQLGTSTWLLANIKHKTSTPFAREGDPFGGIDRYVIREQQGFKIGFFGVVDKEWMRNLPKGQDQDFEYTDFVQTAIDMANELRAKGCELVFVITHMSNAHDEELLENPDVNINIVFGGHDHVYYMRRYHNKLLLKSGSDFDQFSNILMQFSQTVSKDETKGVWVDKVLFENGKKVDKLSTDQGAVPAAAEGAQTQSAAPGTVASADPKQIVLSDADEDDENEQTSEEDLQPGKVKNYSYMFDEVTSNPDANRFVFSLETLDKKRYLEVRIEMVVINPERDLDNPEISQYIDTEIYPRIREYMTSALKISDPMDAREVTILSRESEVGDLVADILRIDYRVDVSIINAGSIKSEAFFRENFFFVEKDIKKMFSRNNKMLVVELKGADLLSVMNLFFDKVPKPHGNFIVFSGLKMKIDTSPDVDPKNRIIENSVMIGDDHLDHELVYSIVILDYLWAEATKQLPIENQQQFGQTEDELRKPIDSIRNFLRIPQDPENIKEFQYFKTHFPAMTVDELSQMEKVSLERTITTFTKEDVGDAPQTDIFNRATNSLMKRLKFYALADSVSEEREVPVFVIKPKKDDRLIIVDKGKPLLLV